VRTRVIESAADAYVQQVCAVCGRLQEQGHPPGGHRDRHDHTQGGHAQCRPRIRGPQGPPAGDAEWSHQPEVPERCTLLHGSQPCSEHRFAEGVVLRIIRERQGGPHHRRQGVQEACEYGRIRGRTRGWRWKRMGHYGGLVQRVGGLVRVRHQQAQGCNPCNHRGRGA